MRDKRPYQPVDARISFERPLGQLRELLVVAGWQVVTDLPELFVHDVEIVHEPFGCGRNRPFLADRLRDGAVGLQEDTSVLLDPKQQPTMYDGFSP